MCLIARTLELLGIGQCYVYDPNHLIRARYGKSRTRRMNKVSAGAFRRIAFERVEDPEEFLTKLPDRKVAAVTDEGATPLTEFIFRQDDTLVFGSESFGIQPGVLETCEARTTIPPRGATESLNLAVAVGIFLFEFFRQEATHSTG